LIKDKLNIAIYSGEIPSSVFIENLIEGISHHSNVLIFGKKGKKYDEYKRRILNDKLNIKIYPNYSSQLLNTIINSFYLFSIIINNPQHFKIIIGELRKTNFWKLKIKWLNTILPIIFHKPDIFHLQWPKEIDKWFFLQENFNIKIILSLRGAHINYTPLVNKDIEKKYLNYFPYIEAFHAVSLDVANNAIKYNANQNQTSVIYSIIKKDTLNKFTIKNLEIKSKIKILTIGRYHWKKAYQDAFESLKLISNKEIDFQYDIIASGQIPDNLIYMRNILQLDEKIKFLNPLNHEDLLKKMIGYDVLILPSWEEGIANVVIEAMCIGLPVITSNCGGMSEIIEDEKSGWIYELGNTEELATKIIRRINVNQVECEIMVRNAYNVILNKFDYDINIKKFMELYRKISSQ